jgi:hypothetical protein
MSHIIYIDSKNAAPKIEVLNSKLLQKNPIQFEKDSKYITIDNIDFSDGDIVTMTGVVGENYILSNPLSIQQGSSRLTINHANHGFTDKTNIVIDMISGYSNLFGNIPMDIIFTQHQIYILDNDRYQIELFIKAATDIYDTSDIIRYLRVQSDMINNILLADINTETIIQIIKDKIRIELKSASSKSGKFGGDQVRLNKIVIDNSHHYTFNIPTISNISSTIILDGYIKSSEQLINKTRNIFEWQNSIDGTINQIVVPIGNYTINNLANVISELAGTIKVVISEDTQTTKLYSYRKGYLENMLHIPDSVIYLPDLEIQDAWIYYSLSGGMINNRGLLYRLYLNQADWVNTRIFIDYKTIHIESNKINNILSVTRTNKVFHINHQMTLGDLIVTDKVDGNTYSWIVAEIIDSNTYLVIGNEFPIIYDNFYLLDPENIINTVPTTSIPSKYILVTHADHGLIKGDSVKLFNSGGEIHGEVVRVINNNQYILPIDTFNQTLYQYQYPIQNRFLFNKPNSISNILGFPATNTNFGHIIMSTQPINFQLPNYYLCSDKFGKITDTMGKLSNIWGVINSGKIITNKMDVMNSSISEISLDFYNMDGSTVNIDSFWLLVEFS